MDKRIKKVAEYMMPYGILQKIRGRNNKDFFREGYFEYLNSADNINISGEKYKKIVSVVGLGYSGSGAILDLLCEFDNCDVIGTDPNANVLGIDHKGLFEANFLRLSGGLFDIEKYIASNNYFQNDAVINRFINLCNSLTFFRNDKNVRLLFYQFFDEIVDQCIWDVNGVPYNSHLTPYKESSSIFFIKPISKDSYYKKSQRFLGLLFSYLNKNNKDYLVFDQLLADGSFNMDDYFNYIPGCKLIVSYRDPRDIYAMAIKHNIDWIAHEDVDSFISWYKRVIRNLVFDSEKYLVVQFERLVNEYETQVKRISEYLEITEGHHLDNLNRKFFNPDVSRVNVGLWKHNESRMLEFDFIYNSLKEYCFQD